MLRLPAGEVAGEVVLESDEALLERVRAGERGAAGAFHDRVRPVIDRTIRRLLGTRDADAEDVAQQALIELVTTIDRFRRGGVLDAWVTTVTAHMVYKQLRRRRTERGLFCELLVEPSRPAVVLPSLQLRSVLRRAVELLEDMNEARAWAFVLHDVLGFDIAEVAVIQQVSAAAAQSRLSRGRRELQTRIAADPELARALEDEGASA